MPVLRQLISTEIQYWYRSVPEATALPAVSGYPRRFCLCEFSGLRVFVVRFFLVRAILCFMATRFSMDVEEYKRTTFEGADCEFLDGEVVERNMGELPHSTVQMEVAFLLRQLTYSQQIPTGQLQDSLRTENPLIEISLASVLPS